MNRILTFIFLTIFLISGNTYARQQQRRINLQDRITIREKNIRTGRLLQIANDQTGVKFSLNSHRFPLSKVINMKAGNLSIAEMLLLIKTNTGIRYTILGDHIIFIDEPESRKEKITPDKNRLPILAQEGAPESRRNGPVKKRNAFNRNIPAVSFKKQSIAGNIGNIASKANSFTLSYIDDTIPYPPASLFNSNPGKLKSPVGDSSFSKANKSTVRVRNHREKKELNLKPFLKTGVMFDESFYLSPVAHAGFSFLYSVICRNIGVHASGWRYGAGSSMRVNGWELHITATTGRLSKSFDTTGRELFIKAKLHKATIVVESKLGNNLRLQYGPSINILKTKYYLNGTLTPLYIDESVANKRYKLLIPPYTLENSYSSLSFKNTRIWVGLQVSILYTIDFPEKH